jgi:hypothetical protein
MAQTAETHATLITDRVISTVGGRIGALTVAKAKLEKRLTAHEGQLIKCEDELQGQTKLKMNDGKHFSRFSAWFAFGVAVLMILADVVISINLVPFFGIGNPKVTDTFWQRLFNPELLLFSLGIAFCTVYIKIFYDDYLGGKLGYLYKHFKELCANGVNKWWLSVEFWGRFIVKTFILICLIAMLYYLARYRTYFTLYSSDEQDAIKDILDIKTNNIAKDLPQVLLWSFIGITILFPVISGIALSIWMNTLSNRRNLRDAVQDQDKALDLFYSCKDDLLQQTFVLEQLSKYLLEWNKREEKIRLISDYFTQHYNQGYKVGYVRANGNDFYQIIEVARNEELNQLLTRKEPKTHEKAPKI